MRVHAEPLVAGSASGVVLRMDAPISFWGGIDAATSEVTMAGHPQHGKTIADTILVVPDPIGSSSSSAIMLELIRAGLAPRALILGLRDAILPIGVIVARQMGWGSLPVLLIKAPQFCSGDLLEIGTDGRIEQKPAPRG